jgi:cobalt-zinc-cadmium efflux system membrane fusion protein
MERRKITRFGIPIGIAGLLALVAAGVVFSRTGKETPSPDAAEASRPGEDARKGGNGREEGHGHEGEPGKEKSDLDRPVEEMWAAKCEHDILQHACDECRYEIGAVKLASSIVSEKGKAGLVGTATAGGISYSESRTFPGEVKRSEGKTVHVTSPLPGQVRKVFADIGARVGAGDSLFEIDSHEVAETKGEYLKKEATRGLARKTAEREAKLFEKKIAAEAEVLEARARLSEAEVESANARARLLRLGVPETEIAAIEHKSLDRMTGLLTVRTPQGGVVLKRHVNQGERVEPGKDLFLISDLSEVWVWADLREGDIPAVIKRTSGGGGKIPALVRAPGGKEYRGILDILSGTMSEETRTVKARIVVPNPDGLLRPGMFVTVRLLLSEVGSVLAVPKVAVLSDEGRPFVFVHKEGEYWIRRPVKLGHSLGDMVEIRSGIARGQKIIADGSFLLKSDVLRRKMGAGCAE